jgi:hypothetical protein
MSETDQSKLTLADIAERTPHIDVKPDVVRVAPGRKDDHGKLPYDLLPWGPIRYVVQVLQFGADQYGIDNWKIVPKHRSRYFSAAMRHVLAWFQGEKLDSQSGLPHLAHAVTCLLFLLWKDDNP